MKGNTVINWGCGVVPNSMDTFLGGQEDRISQNRVH